MRAQKLAQLVVSGATWHSWFDDEVTLDPDHAPPLDRRRSGATARCTPPARRRIWSTPTHAFPRSRALRLQSRWATLHELLSKIKEIEDAVANGQVLPLTATTPDVLDAARLLFDQVQETRVSSRASKAADGDWPTCSCAIKCRQPSFASERAALEALFDDLDMLIEARAAFLKRPVDFPGSRVCIPRKTREAIARGAELGRPFAAIAIGAAEAKEHIKLIRISGLPPASARRLGACAALRRAARAGVVVRDAVESLRRRAFDSEAGRRACPSCGTSRSPQIWRARLIGWRPTTM